MGVGQLHVEEKSKFVCSRRHWRDTISDEKQYKGCGAKISSSRPPVGEELSREPQEVEPKLLMKLKIEVKNSKACGRIDW